MSRCVPPCGLGTPRSGGLLAEPEKAAIIAEIEARSGETPHTFISEGVLEPETEIIAESEPAITEITAEKETEKSTPAQMAQSVKPIPSSSEPRNGDVRVVDGERQIYLLGFGWIVDGGGGSVGTMVGNPGDQLTGRKVGIMGGGTTVDGKGDINKIVGIMGDDEAPSRANTAPPAEQPEPTGDVIYTEIQPPVTKDSTPPAYKPNGEPNNP